MKKVIKIAPKKSVCIKTDHTYINLRRLVIGTLWFFCVFFAQSCASTTDYHLWIGDGIDAQNMHDRGEYDEAEAIYQRLLSSSPPNKEKRRWIQYKVAELAKDRGDAGLAKTKASAVHAEKVIDEYGAKSLFMIADLDQDDSAYWDVISTYPYTYEAEKALKYLEAKSLTNSQKLDFAARLRRQIDSKDSSLVDNLLLSEARTYISLSRPNKALPILRELFYWDERASLSDDALWVMADLYRSAQQWKDALDVYAIFRSRIDSSWFVGSYTPHLVDDSIFESGRIALLFLGDYTLAASYFDDYLILFPDAILADDALWFLAESYRLSGDETKKDETLTRLNESFPDSRYLKARVEK